MRKLKQTTECTYSKNKYTIAFRNITDHNHEITDRVWQASFKCVCVHYLKIEVAKYIGVSVLF